MTTKRKSSSKNKITIKDNNRTYFSWANYGGLAKKCSIFVSYLFLCLIVCAFFCACDSNNFYRTRDLMKAGKLTNYSIENSTLNPIIEIDSLENFVYTLNITFPNDTTNYTFLIDTGSPSMISTKLAKKLAIQTSYNFIDNTFENHPDFDITILPKIKIGNLIYENIAVIIDDVLPKRYNKHNTQYNNKQNKNYDGVIGANIMQHHSWFFDPKNKKIIIYDNIKQKANIQGYLAVPFVRNLYRIPKFYGFINKFTQKQVFHLSTGFSGGIKMPLVDFQRSTKLGLDSLKAIINTNIAFNHQANFANYLIEKEKNINKTYIDTSYQILTPLFKLDSIKSYNLPTILGQGNAWHLGNAFWKDFTLLIDWKERKFYIKRIVNT
jgi:hypothetical protein